MFPRWLDGPIQLEYAPQVGGSLNGLLTEYAAVHEEGIVPFQPSVFRGTCDLALRGCLIATNVKRPKSAN
jgi:hypothetical protein